MNGLNVNFNSASLDSLGSNRPAHADIKHRCPPLPQKSLFYRCRLV